ncbi:TPA: hypothetical protein DDW69_04540 [candidate division CPR2 bacterium]|uniref:Tyrosine recombinase XerC n=1 Tax=candidate division CPR2 bacterium GW2011_GWC1_41_48 TaxID=1618344 RepID=A0A0G0WB67_UNCC2|nr:MAG: Tyrosine recombinase XerC [candidate division CPR2 bacterium GW2011_GWC2_39_35]KKR29072.1 MAG: Tyrosine recombinase XerC [candidate division CPR2 bacterium GW2011_GWD2_39_7]KKS09312.1 MAG: Tyrosine recombinase XerC [candidate division CPR2 bacterium GW2011_GWC1_41_48]OGB70560.1 MAG: hypothetical protein A2Y26_04435 [candidate division CPR2 bacterium GWD2_39_7]HBG82068.1 hypothetical protein [candidate division CPR2 bacterium]
MTTADLISDFLEYCELEKNHSELTILNYEHYLRRFLEFAESKEGDDFGPQKIDMDLVRSYRLHLNRMTDQKGNTLKKITQNYHVIALRAFLKYLAKRDVRSLSAEKIELGDAKRKQVEFLEFEEVVRLMDAPLKQKQTETNKIISVRDKAILELLFSTGLRVSELVGLNRTQVNLDRGEFMVRGKGSKDRVVFMSDGAKHWINEYLKLRADNFKPLFIRYSGSKDEIEDGEYLRLTSRSVQRIVNAYARAAGIVKKVTPHTLRHSFATDLLINGADIRSVQSMLGHSSITTTQIYTHLTNKQLKEVHQAFHGRRRS